MAWQGPQQPGAGTGPGRAGCGSRGGSVNMKPTRDGLGEGLLELGKANPGVVVLSGDLAGSTRAEGVAKGPPSRFFNMGINEQDLIGTAVGLALAGKVAFVCSFSAFITSRAHDQIRVSLCYNQANVKAAATHSAITLRDDVAR